MYMMIKKKRIQVVLSSSIEKKLRKRISRHGFKKGDMSSYIEKLIKKDNKRRKE